eukprot:UN27268
MIIFKFNKVIIICSDKIHVTIMIFLFLFWGTLSASSILDYLDVKDIKS